jgi:hypothetical protein
MASAALISPIMGGSSALESALERDSDSRRRAGQTAFPSKAGALLERLGSLYGLDGELEPVRRVVEPLAAVPVETSVSLGSGVETTLRLTLGLPTRPEDPHARSALVAALSGLGAERVAAAVDEALASVAPAPGRRRLVRGLALRVRRGEPARPRAATWVGGETAAEQSARVTGAMLRLGLECPAALHERLAAQLAANPFNAVVLYGLGFDVGPDRVQAAKSYFASEWPDVAVGLLCGPLADELRLDGVEGFELLAASARADRRRGRWLLEVSFELPGDPARGIRAKAYLRPDDLGADEAEGHATVLRLAAEFGLDPTPYEELVEAVRPDGLSAERPCSLMAGVSASARGPSLEVYLFADRSAVAASRPG